jgi:hypothetical protein
MPTPRNLHHTFAAINTSNQPGKPLMFWKWTKKIGLGLIGTIGILALSGAFYQEISERLDAKKYFSIGQLVDIGEGRKMHLYVTGSGRPTVVLDAGMGCNALSWSLVQPEVAKFTRVVSFDRPGNGWSDESHLDRTSQNIITELHTALQKANIPGPYILVGHSFGGLNAQLFANLYPEVLGVVLVDSSHADQLEKMGLPQMNHTLSKLAFRLGIVRLLMHLPIYTKEFAMFPKPIQKQLLALTSTTKFIKTVLQETSHLQTSCDQLKSMKGHLGDKPLTVISAVKKMDAKGSGYTEEQIDSYFGIFQTLQKDLVTKSTQGKQVFAKESDHMIPLHQPQIIVDSIKEMVDSLHKEIINGEK